MHALLAFELNSDVSIGFLLCLPHYTLYIGMATSLSNDLHKAASILVVTPMELAKWLPPHVFGKESYWNYQNISSTVLSRALSWERMTMLKRQY